jgi:hypothetical protein
LSSSFEVSAIIWSDWFKNYKTSFHCFLH